MELPNTCFVLLLLCMCSLQNFVQCSVLTIQASPQEIHANLTPSLTLTCAVNNVTVVSGTSSLVGRDLSQAAGVQFLTSLIVMRDGKNVASITEHAQAKPHLDLTNLKVTGNLGATSGFLTLTWDFPSDKQLGEYTCESNGLTDLGHSMILSRTTEVNMLDIEVKDLVHYIHNQQVQINNQMALINSLQNEMKIQEQNLTLELARYRHVETGNVDCGASSSWNNKVDNIYGAKDIYTEKSETFATAYDRPPVVFLSIEHMAESESKDNYYYLQLASVDASGFTVRCQTYDSRIGGMRLSWISIPQ